VLHGVNRRFGRWNDRPPVSRPYDPSVTPTLIAVVLGAGLLALLPVRRLAERTPDRAIVSLYFVTLWIVLAAAILVPPIRRLAIPVAIVLALAPWLSLRASLDRLLRRAPRDR
jgi:hypothetical protein